VSEMSDERYAQSDNNVSGGNDTKECAAQFATLTQTHLLENSKQAHGRVERVSDGASVKRQKGDGAKAIAAVMCCVFCVIAL